MYIGTLSATKCNPVIRDYYERLCTAGKPKKVALVACMRKLLSALNAMLRQGISWQAYDSSYFNRSTYVDEASQGRGRSPSVLARLEHVGGAKTDKTPALTPALVAVLT